MCEGDGFEELQDRGLSPGPLIVCFNKHSILLVCCCGCLVAESSPTLFDPMDYSLPGSSDHGILQARILQWVAIPSSRGSSQPRDQTQVSCTAGRFFTIWATKETPESDCYPPNSVLGTEDSPVKETMFLLSKSLLSSRADIIDNKQIN